MDNLFLILRGWHPLLQFVFLVLFGLTAVGTVLVLARLAVVLVRGWPPPGTPELTDWDDGRAEEPDEPGAPGARVRS